FAHMRLDRQRCGLAHRRQRLQGTRRAMHEIADALHIEDDEVLAVAVDHALELADHRRFSWRECTASSPPPLRGRSMREARLEGGIANRPQHPRSPPSPTLPLKGGGSRLCPLRCSEENK